MAPKLSEYQHRLSNELIRSGNYSNEDIARARMLSKPMSEALIEYLYDKPDLDLYLEEMSWFIWDEFQVIVSTDTISRALHHAGWSKMEVKY